MKHQYELVKNKKEAIELVCQDCNMHCFSIHDSLMFELLKDKFSLTLDDFVNDKESLSEEEIKFGQQNWKPAKEF